MNTPGLSHLTGLVGAKLEFVGGPHLPSYLVAPQVLISFDRKALSFEGDVVFSDLQGFPNEFSHLSVQTANVADVQASRDAGLQYFFLNGHVLTGIDVLEETVESRSQETSNWTLVTDVAVLFKFEHGVVAISKLGHQDEALRVYHNSNTGSIDLPATESLFEPDLFEDILTSRRVMSLELALAR